MREPGLLSWTIPSLKRHTPSRPYVLSNAPAAPGLPVHKLRKVRRKGGAELEIFRPKGECETGGVQRLTGKQQSAFESFCPTGLDKFKITGFIKAIDFVAYDRVTGERKMDTDLVCPAGFWLCLNHRKSSFLPDKLLQHFEFGNRRITARVHNLLEPDSRRLEKPLTKERLVDREQLRLRPAGDDCNVDLADLVACHEPVQLMRSRAILSDQDESARFPVEAIDERDLAAIQELKGEKLVQLVPERSGGAGLLGMDRQEGRLVDKEKIVVLENDPESRQRGKLVPRAMIRKA